MNGIRSIDLTLQDESGHELDMGCPIDETTERAWPDFYADATAAFTNGEPCAIYGRTP